MGKAVILFYYFYPSLHTPRGIHTAVRQNTITQMSNTESKDQLLSLIRQKKPMTLGQQARLVLQLSTPAILAQLTTTMMQYIDASMVGSMGAEASASIGIVETTVWLLGSICSATAAGFYVQVSHQLGADDGPQARDTLRQGIVSVLAVSMVLSLTALAVSPFLPVWLGGNADINASASAYFAIIAMGIPAFQFSIFGSGMLRSSGNMVIPSIMSVVMMSLDVVFNFFLIFPTRTVSILGTAFTMPGAGLSVEGAAIGTVSAECIAASITMYLLCFRRGELSLRRRPGRFRPTRRVLGKALHISLPMGLQQGIMCSAYVATTLIIAPLGTFAIAANSFGIIIESLCYMPGYGIADAATTLVGQSLGAARHELMKRFAWISVLLGMAVMAVMGVVMYAGAPFAMSLMTPVSEVRSLGAGILRIEAFAEPMFAAAIVSYGVFVGAAQTLVPSLMNLASMWGVRITLAALLAPTMGLRGVWLAMCIELCFRGFIFLVRLRFWRSGRSKG